jgi:hypothetical protein
MNGRTWQLRLILIWSIELIVFSGCKTPGNLKSTPETAKVLAVLILPVPPESTMEQVRFLDRDGGLWLSYQYRALERNVTALWEYAERLIIVIEFYQEVNDGY